VKNFTTFSAFSTGAIQPNTESMVDYLSFFKPRRPKLY